MAKLMALDVTPIQGLTSTVNSSCLQGWVTEDMTAQLKKQMPLLLSGLGQNEALMSQ